MIFCSLTLQLIYLSDTVDLNLSWFVFHVQVSNFMQFLLCNTKSVEVFILKRQGDVDRWTRHFVVYLVWHWSELFCQTSHSLIGETALLIMNKVTVWFYSNFKHQTESFQHRKTLAIWIHFFFSDFYAITFISGFKHTTIFLFSRRKKSLFSLIYLSGQFPHSWEVLALQFVLILIWWTVIYFSYLHMIQMNSTGMLLLISLHSTKYRHFYENNACIIV